MDFENFDENFLSRDDEPSLVERSLDECPISVYIYPGTLWLPPTSDKEAIDQYIIGTLVSDN